MSRTRMTCRLAGNTVEVPSKELQVFKKEEGILMELNNNKPFDPRHSTPLNGGPGLEWKLGDRSTLMYSLDPTVKNPTGTENPGYMWEIKLVLADGKKIDKKDCMLQALLTQVKLDMGRLKAAAQLDLIAGELEAVDPRLALALDRVSDGLEGRKSYEQPKEISIFIDKMGNFTELVRDHVGEPLSYTPRWNNKSLDFKEVQNAFKDLKEFTDKIKEKDFFQRHVQFYRAFLTKAEKVVNFLTKIQKTTSDDDRDQLKRLVSEMLQESRVLDKREHILKEPNIRKEKEDWHFKNFIRLLSSMVVESGDKDYGELIISPYDVPYKDEHVGHLAKPIYEKFKEFRVKKEEIEKSIDKKPLDTLGYYLREFGYIGKTEEAPQEFKDILKRIKEMKAELETYYSTLDIRNRHGLEMYEKNINRNEKFLKELEGIFDSLNKLNIDNKELSAYIKGIEGKVNNYIKEIRESVPINREIIKKVWALVKEQKDYLEKKIEELKGLKKASLTARLDEIAGELERVDPRLALALDRVSDKLEALGR